MLTNDDAFLLPVQVQCVTLRFWPMQKREYCPSATSFYSFFLLLSDQFPSFKADRSLLFSFFHCYSSFSLLREGQMS